MNIMNKFLDGSIKVAQNVVLRMNAKNISELWKGWRKEKKNAKACVLSCKVHMK